MKLSKPEVKIPYNDHHSIRYWIDEQIWGHRIWDSQTPWLIFLEFMGIVDSAFNEGPLLNENEQCYPLLFYPCQRILLRNLLYNNPILPVIVDKYPDSAQAWKKWKSWMEINARGVSNRKFDYLEERFPKFSDFAKFVSVIRTSTVESDSNRRWSSRFLFPFGNNCLYEDLNITNTNKVSREYINFGRTGELLYLMLCRSAARDELVSHLTNLISSSNRWNSLVGQLQASEHENREERGKSYLPYTHHHSFNALGEDILHLFKLGLPGFDAYPHLSLIAAFHVMLYQLNVSSEKIGVNRQSPIICEIVAPRKTLVRELSFSSYQNNSQLSTQAVTTFIDSIANTNEWREALSSHDGYLKCKDLLLDAVVWPREDDDYDKAHNPETLIKYLRQSAISRHRQNAGNVHRTYGRAIGLISKRGTNRLRYAPNDVFLKSLILANVTERMEFKEFLHRIYDKYGMVIGEREASQALEESDFDHKVFQSNSERLEQRLGSLGMLRRLSDACAYVLNPYAKGAQ